jgi:hypothetical protein
MRNGRIYLYPCDDLSPFTKGTWDDLREAGITPAEGLRIQFYDDDADDNGRPCALVFEGVAHREPSKGWMARIDRSTFRHEAD